VILRQDNFEDTPIYHKKTLVETPRKSFDEWMSNITQIKKYVGLINMMLEEADNYNFAFRLTHDEMQRKILRELWRKSQPSTIIIK
jgi:maltose-binding protein MalE